MKTSQIMVRYGLDAMTVEAEKLDTVDFTSGDLIEERDAIKTASFLGVTSIDMIELQHSTIINSTCCTLASESINSIISRWTPASALTCFGQLSRSFRIASVPLINLWLGSEIFAASTHARLRQLLIDAAVDAHDSRFIHIENHTRREDVS